MSAPVETRRRALRGQAVSLSGNPFLTEGCLDHVEDALIFIEDGRIVELGTHDTLMKQGCQYAALYRAYDQAGTVAAR